MRPSPAVTNKAYVDGSGTIAICRSVKLSEAFVPTAESRKNPNALKLAKGDAASVTVTLESPPNCEVMLIDPPASNSMRSDPE